MTIKEIQTTNPFYSQALEMRYSAFFKEFGLKKEVTPDELEPVSRHFVVHEGDTLIAYGRLSPLEFDVWRISQMVVAADHRKQGIATNLMRHLIHTARALGAKKIQLNAQLAAQGLYRRLGFCRLGEAYRVSLTGVEHINMALELHATQ